MLMPVAAWMRSKLPSWSVPQIDFRNGAAKGDNDGLDGLGVPMLEQAVQKAVESAKGGLAGDPAVDAASAEAVKRHDPANIEYQGQDPANVESKGSDPANIESPKQRPNGQKRPESQ